MIDALAELLDARLLLVFDAIEARAQLRRSPSLRRARRRGRS